MCGIAGILSKDPRLNLAHCIRKITEKIAHRGPDAEGVFVEKEVALGHRRLSIIDLSTEANQPFTDHSGRYHLVYNGELYNFQSLRERLSGQYQFITQGDTEVILAAYIQWGEDCLQHFNGMFALAIWDQHEKRLFMARDRLGIKPLYYYQKDGTLIFASEIRAILASDIVKRALKPAALVDYLTYQTIHAPATLVEGIHLLPAAHHASYQNDRFKVQRYWDMASCQYTGVPKERSAIQADIRDLLQQAVSRRLISDVPLGAFLSGGIDSSAIVALMAESSHQAINTFSVVFGEGRYDESVYSQMIAKKYRTQHSPILLTPSDFLDMLPHALQAMDSPSGDGINSYVVSKVTKAAGITVALSGLGGDELFAGYPVFRQWMQLYQKKWLWKLPLLLRNGTAQLMKALLNNHQSDRLQELISLPEMEFELAYPIFRKLRPTQAITQLNPSLPPHDNAVSTILATHSPSRSHIPQLSQVSIGEISSYTQHVLLRDTDQMSMAHALEVRVPFFDHELLEYVLAISDDLKYPTTPKQLLVDSLGDRLPKEIVHRPKMGFVFPWDHWLKNELYSFADHRLRQLAGRDIFDQTQLLMLWKRYIAQDKKVNWLHIWTLVVLEEWLNNNGW